MNPWSLLKLEGQRFFPNMTFRTIVVLYAVFFALLWILAHLIGGHLTFNNNGQSFSPTADLFFYPKNWALLAYIGSWLNSSLAGFLGVFMITLEFSNKTLRQSVIFGLSRRDLFLSKIGSAVALAIGATLWYVLLGFGGLLSAMEHAGGFTLPPLGCVAGFFLQTLGCFLMGTLFGLLIRQTALATLAYLAYAFFLESVGRWIFLFAILKTRALLFLPDSVLESLTPFPVPEAVGNVVKENTFLLPLSGSETTLAALAYLVLFGLILLRKLSRSDL